jgi:hypothetical protein
VWTDGLNENIISIAFTIEENSGMNRADLAELTAFAAVADHLSFRAAASQLGVTPSAVRAENLVRFDLVIESLNVGRDGGASTVPAEPAWLALQVQEPSRG